MKTFLHASGYYCKSAGLFFPLLVFSCSISIAQTVRYVSPTGVDTNPGTFASPYKTIARGITMSATSGDTIKVAAGTYTGSTSVNKSVAIIGTGATSSDVVVDGTTYTLVAGNGFAVTANNVIIRNLKVTNFNVGISNTAIVSNLLLDNVQLVENFGAGFFSGFSIDSLTITNSKLSYNGNKTGYSSTSTSKRGIYLLNGVSYSKIKIDNNTVDNNGVAGIEISSVSLTTSIDGITIINNLVRNNLDAQVSTWLGTANPLKKAITISNNTLVVSDTARYGLEIRNPAGNGKISGDGSVVVSNNSISVVSHTGNGRDMAAIAVIRRKENSALATMNDQPQGVVVFGNSITDFQNPKAGDAFGIVFGGIGHKAYDNSIANTEFSIQLQSGNTNFAANTSTPNVFGQANDAYFDRDNSKYACVEVGTNTITASGAQRFTTGAATTTSILPAKTTTNTTIGETFCSLQQAIDFKATVNGNTITANPGTYNEQVIINKGIVIDGLDSTNRIATVSGSTTGVLGIFTITAQNVTIKNFKFVVDLSRTHSAIITSGNASNLLITGNTFLSSNPLAGTLLPYGRTNAININVSWTGALHSTYNPITNVIIQSNTIGSINNVKFRAGVAPDLVSGLLVGGNNLIDGNNFLASVNHDVIIRNYLGDHIVKNNIFKGGGVEVSASNGNGIVMVSNNIFDGTYAQNIKSAMVRIFTNSFVNRTINFSYNQFVNQKWSISFENTRNVVLDHNDLTATYDSFRLISVNTKLRQTGRPASLEFIDIKLTNNNLSSTTGLATGSGIEFLNFDQRSPVNNYMTGNYIIGEVGNENNFNEHIPTFIKVSNLNGDSTNTPAFLNLYPEYNGIQYFSKTGYWTRDIFARHNRYFVNGSLKLASTFSETDFNSIYSSIFDRQDDINIGAVVLMPTWSGTTNEDWSDPTNWSYQLSPAPGLDAIIYPQVNRPELKADAACDTLIILGGMTVKTGAYNLTVYGNVRGNGRVDGTTGSMILAGTVNQHISGSLLIKNLILNNAAGARIEAGSNNKVSLLGKYTPAQGILTTNDNLVLKSSDTATARISSGSSSVDYIVGKVTIERYIPGHRAWRFLTSPVKGASALTIRDAWQEGVNNTSLNYAANQNPLPGYGTHITLGNASALGFDVGINSNPSIKGYNPATGKWDALPSTNIAITNYPAYMLFVRGSRSINLSQGVYAPISNTVLRSAGTLKMGDQNFSVAATGFTVMGNPYASPINFDQIAKSNSTNIQDNFYLWDPKITGTNGVGGFTNISWNGSSYDITPSYSGSTMSQYIQSGAAFLTRSANGATPGTLIVKESDKTGAGSDNVNRPVNVVGEKLVTNLYSINTNGTTSIVDGVLNGYGDAYSNEIDNMDAVKLANFAESLSTLRDGQLLTVERRQPINIGDTIFFNMLQMKAKSYKFEFIAHNPSAINLTGFIEDSYLNTSTPVNLNGTTIFNFNVVNIPGSYKPGRFQLVFKLLSALPVTFNNIKAREQNNDVKVEWKVENESGVKLYEVEKSVDGLHFTGAGIVLAAGNAHGVYNWLDEKANEGDNYYRVKMIGVDGLVQYSSIVKIKRAKSREQIVLNTKMVIGCKIAFSLLNMPAGMYGIKLMDNLGRVMFKKELMHAAGSSTENIELRTQPAKGIYMLEFTISGNKKITEKLIVE